MHAFESCIQRVQRAVLLQKTAGSVSAAKMGQMQDCFTSTERVVVVKI